MSIYLKINDIYYKLPNRVTIGRGAPFTQFNEDKTISRAHFTLYQTKNGVLVKDNGSKTGTLLNGKKILNNKPISWNQGDTLSIGKFSLEILAHAPNQKMIEIKGLLYAKSDLSLLNKAVILLVILSSLFLMFFIWQIEVPTITKFKLIGLEVSFLCSVGLFLKYKDIFSDIKETKDIFLGDDGLTVHFLDGQNMTFKFSELIEWIVLANNFILKTKNGKIFTMKYSGDRKKLKLYLKTNLPKNIKTDNPKGFLLIALTTAIVFFLIKYFSLIE